MNLTRTLALLFAMLALSACDKTVNSTGKVDFVTQIKPLLQSRCVICHNDETFAGGLLLQSKGTAFVDQLTGPTIKPGDPAKSVLYITLTLPETDHKAMPAMGHRVSDAEIALIKRWIEQGAEWPEGEAGVIKAPAHKGES